MGLGLYMPQRKQHAKALSSKYVPKHIGENNCLSKDKIHNKIEIEADWETASCQHSSSDG